MQFLIVTHDTVTEEGFRHAATKMSATVEFCPDVKCGFATLEQERFDVIVIDCDDVYQGSCLLRAARSSRPNKSSVLVALTNGETNAADAVDMGAHFVVAKPLSPDRACFELRRACQALGADQRRSQRHSLEVPVYLSFGQVIDRRAEAFNLSLGGIGVRVSEPLDDDEAVQVRMWLPGYTDPIRAHGDIAWSDPEGNTGIKFTGMSVASLEMLTRWLQRATLSTSSETAKVADRLSAQPAAR